MIEFGIANILISAHVLIQYKSLVCVNCEVKAAIRTCFEEESELASVWRFGAKMNYLHFVINFACVQTNLAYIYYNATPY